MTGVLRVRYLFLLGCSAAFASPAIAQDTNDIVLVHRLRDNLITVVATGTPISADGIGQSVSIVDHNEIASIQGPDLTRVLERLSGVTVTRNGGLGNFTGMRVRGSEPLIHAPR